MPGILDSVGDPWNLRLAAKYLDKSFNLFDEKALGRQQSSEIQDWISDEIERRFGPENENQVEPSGPE
jgi:hypothetical protein